MAHEKYTFFEGEAYVHGNSIAIIIPKSVREYLGIYEGDTVEVKIIKVKSGRKVGKTAKKG